MQICLRHSVQQGQTGPHAIRIEDAPTETQDWVLDWADPAWGSEKERPNPEMHEPPVRIHEHGDVCVCVCPVPCSLLYVWIMLGCVHAACRAVYEESGQARCKATGKSYQKASEVNTHAALLVAVQISAHA